MSAESATKGQRYNSDAGDGTALDPAEDLQERRRSSLLRTIECEIVPRLMMLERPSSREAQAASLRRDVVQLTALLLADDVSASTQFVETLQERGVPMDRICLELLAPAARRIVELWERQHCGDEELRTGLNALHGILLELRGASRADCVVQRAN